MKKLYAIITFCLFCGYTVFSQTISSNAPLCGNANLTLELSATGGSTYAWTGPNGFTSTQQKPTIKNVNWKNRGVYTVIIDNKTTLTTDVNIKDPVAFTVPKEISVCEGGTLFIEPKSARLTDSTEVADSFQFKFPFYSFTANEGIIKNLSASQVGICQVIGTSNNNGCSSTQNVSVKLNTNPNCGIITIESLEKIRMCFGQEISIPFNTKGNFKQGTKFNVYIAGNYPYELLTTTDKSPAIVKMIPSKFDGNSIIIKIVADDGFNTTAIASKRAYSSYELRDIYTNSTVSCDSAKLNINNFTSLGNIEWLSDNHFISVNNTKEFTTKKSGSYTFKYQLKSTRYEVDKTCSYESQPVKIELGKIPKPYTSLTNNIELCVGKPATLNVFSNTNTTYRWKKDGNYITNANKSTFETLQEGKYQVEAKEGTCTAISDTVVLKKPEKLASGVFLINEKYLYNEPLNPSITICSDSFYDIRFYKYDPDKKIQTVWFKNGEALKDSVNNTLRNNKGAGTYFTKNTYGECTNFSNKVTVNPAKKLSVKMNNNNRSGVMNGSVICEGSYDSLYFNIPYYDSNINKIKSYKNTKWFKDGISYNLISNFDNPSVIKPKQKGSYYASTVAILEDGNECPVLTDTVNISFSSKIQNTSFRYDEKIKAVSIMSCKDTTSITESNYAGLEGRVLNYKWLKDGVTLKQDSSSTLQVTQVGTYQLETTYKGGCTVVSSPYKVELRQLPINFYNPLLASICEGDKYTIYPELEDYSNTNKYSLYKDGQLLNINIDVTEPFAYGLRPALTQSGTYKLKVSDGKCEGTSPDFVLKVDKILTTITPTDSATFCAGKTVDLKASTEAGLSYIWERNGSIISQANRATLTASTDGLYKATLLRGACWATTPSVKLKSLANITPTATLTGDKKIDLDQETNLSVNLTSHAPWTFKLSDGKEYTATKSPFEITVKPLTTTTYSLTEVSNICGTGTVSGTAKIEVIILSTEEERELSVEVFPMPSSEICNWKIETPQATTALVELIDVSGNSQFSEISNTRSQTHQGSINLTNLKAGTYFLKLQAGEKSVTRKVVKF